MSTLFDNSMEFENIERSSVPALDAALAQNILTTRVADDSNSKYVVTDEDGAILIKHLEEYHESDAKQRAMLVDLMLAELADLRTAEDDFDKGEARKVVRKWFDNRSRRALTRFMHFTRKWSARNVFYQENCGEILVLTGQRSNAPAGTPAFFGALQLATTMEWSETGPPPEIRARCAVKMRGHIIRDFQEQLYKFCGVRTFVLCAFLDEGKVIRACG
ncbi:hypothetical protein BC834DRAFT_848664 [Gloeopeniophorella convolvens]|nr:hypothetical protein BC834DRAFT_848664 [Gloeopeniophorella convolvens]